MGRGEGQVRGAITERSCEESEERWGEVGRGEKREGEVRGAKER